VRQAGQLDCLRNGFDPLTTRVEDGKDKRNKDEMLVQEEKTRQMRGGLGWFGRRHVVEDGGL